jgi:hypothetical protein
MFLQFSVAEIKQIVANHCNNLFNQKAEITPDLVTVKMVAGKFDEDDEFDGVSVNMGEAIARRDNPIPKK